MIFTLIGIHKIEFFLSILFKMPSSPIISIAKKLIMSRCGFCREFGHNITHCRHSTVNPCIEEMKRCCSHIIMNSTIMNQRRIDLKDYLSGKELIIVVGWISMDDGLEYALCPPEVMSRVTLPKLKLLSIHLHLPANRPKQELIMNLLNHIMNMEAFYTDIYLVVRYSFSHRPFVNTHPLPSRAASILTPPQSSVNPVPCSNYIVTDRKIGALLVGEKECCICYETFENNLNMVVTNCKHEFCVTCAKQMYSIAKHNNRFFHCPICRQVIRYVVTTREEERSLNYPPSSAVRSVVHV